MTDSLPLVGIVVLNWNGKDCLSQCLASLQKLRYERFFIVVVDNASTDSSLAAAEQQFPQCIYIRHAENKGFAAGMNSGIRAALSRGAEWVWVFNNDALAEEQALSHLIEVGQNDEHVGLLSPWIINPMRKVLWFGKGNIDWFRMRAIHTTPKRKERTVQAYESHFVTGCALLIKKELLERIGPFDERFFLYYEDADLSYRAQQAGFRVLVVPQSRVFHREQSQMNSQKLYYLVYSGLLFFQKNATWWQKPYLFLYTVVRRWKNRRDLRAGKDGAVLVRQAYTDFEQVSHE